MNYINIHDEGDRYALVVSSQVLIENHSNYIEGNIRIFDLMFRCESKDELSDTVRGLIYDRINRWYEDGGISNLEKKLTNSRFRKIGVFSYYPIGVEYISAVENYNGYDSILNESFVFIFNK